MVNARLVLSMVIIITLILALPTSAKELTWEPHGFFRFVLGYFQGEGLLEQYLSLYDTFGYSYSADLSGIIYNDHTELTYTVKKEVNSDLDGRFRWSNPLFSAQYNQGVKLKFPMIALAFKNNEIDGFEIHNFSEEANLTLFHGQEANFPMTIIVSGLMPGVTKIRLFDYHEPAIPPSGGDIVEYSEVITANGVTLQRNDDYILNYLNSELKLLIPIEMGTKIEAKFQFKPTKKELSPPGETLSGGVFTKKWLDNNLTAFYFKRGNNVNNVGGIAGSYLEGPVSITGEWAISDGQEFDASQAYYLDCQISDEKLEFKYNVSDVAEDFKEMGVNDFNRGLSREVSLTLEATDDIALRLLTNQYTDLEEEQRINSSLRQGTIDYQLTENQSCQFIFQDYEWSFADKNNSKTDIALGYTYQTKPFTLNFGQYLKNPEDRFLKCSLTLGGLDFNTEYKVKEGVFGQEHCLDVVSFLQPFSGWDINSIVEYRQLFTEKQGDLKVIVNSSSLINSELTARGQYVYFTEVKNAGKNQRYNLGLDYEAEKIVSRLNFLRFNAQSKSAESYVQEVNGDARYQLTKRVQLNYLGDLDSYSQKSIIDDSVYLGNQSLVQSLGFNYLWSDSLDTGVKLTHQNYLTWNNQYLNDHWQTIYEHKQGYAYGMNINYQKNTDQVSLDLEYTPDKLDPIYAFSGQVNFMLADFVIDCRSKLEYSVNKAELLTKNYNCALILPKIYRVEPKLTYNYDDKNTTDSIYLAENYQFSLKYAFNEQRSIFLEARKDYVHNCLETEQNVDSLGILTGIEYRF